MLQVLQQVIVVLLCINLVKIDFFLISINTKQKNETQNTNHRYFNYAVIFIITERNICLCHFLRYYLNLLRQFLDCNHTLVGIVTRIILYRKRCHQNL